MPHTLYVRSARARPFSAYRSDFVPVELSPRRVLPPPDCNQQFIAMLDAYRPSGGLARADEVVGLCQPAPGESARAGAHGLGQPTVRRNMVCFDWESTLWIPLFQFDRNDMSLRPGVRHVQRELIGVFNAWEVASWFCQPNPWLNHCKPADMLADAATEVLHAARAARYVEAG